jgi:hypothetical protein
MSKEFYTPAEVEALTQWTPVGQRDLRHKGFLSNYGAQTKTGRWTYSARDVVAFWVARSLHGFGFDLATLFAVSWTNAETVMRFAKGGHATRYVAFLIDGYRGDGIAHGTSVVSHNTLAEIEALYTFDKVDAVDLKHIGETLPDHIRAILV